MPRFKDHFSAGADRYARFRPRYPDALFTYLASVVPPHARCWDCATGNGQAAVALAEHFTQVVATDASAEQIARAEPHPRVAYRVGPAEASGLNDRSVELVTVAQALHWLDLQAFYAEVDRVLRPGGVLAVWCYGKMELDEPALQHNLDRFYAEKVGPYWPPERRLVEEGYRALDFPYVELEAPPLVMEARMSLRDLVGYVGTWSATRRYVQANGEDPLGGLTDALSRSWGPSATPRTVRWPLSMRVGRKAVR